jgi:hypothetical protein
LDIKMHQHERHSCTQAGMQPRKGQPSGAVRTAAMLDDGGGNEI